MAAHVAKAPAIVVLRGVFELRIAMGERNQTMEIKSDGMGVVVDPAGLVLALDPDAVAKRLEGSLPGLSVSIRIKSLRLVGPDGTLTRMLASGRLQSMILWGPPGSGKTTVARLLALETDLEFEQLSAIFSGVAELRKAFDRAKIRRETGKGTLLFIDEIHRFNRAQQDSFLPYMEDGTITQEHADWLLEGLDKGFLGGPGGFGFGHGPKGEGQPAFGPQNQSGGG